VHCSSLQKMKILHLTLFTNNYDFLKQGKPINKKSDKEEVS